MEVEFASHDLTSQVKKNEMVVTLTNVRTGVTYHWSWRRDRMSEEHLNIAISKETNPQIKQMLAQYNELDKEKMALEICGTLHTIDQAQLSQEMEAKAIENMGSMMIIPYVLKTKAWEMINSQDAVKDHNTISILVDYDANGYVMRPCATSNCKTYEDVLDANIQKSMQMAQSLGWLKQLNGQWTLLNNDGQSAHDLYMGIRKNKPKPGAPGSNVTPKKNRKKRK